MQGSGFHPMFAGSLSLIFGVAIQQKALLGFAVVTVTIIGLYLSPAKAEASVQAVVEGGWLSGLPDGLRSCFLGWQFVSMF